MAHEREHEVARDIELAQRLDATIPVERVEDIAQRLTPRGAPAGTTDVYLAEDRRDRV